MKILPLYLTDWEYGTLIRSLTALPWVVKLTDEDREKLTALENKILGCLKE